MNKNRPHTIDDTILIPVLSPGDKLYHYTSIEGLKGICEGEFWVTERSFLNDFTEFQIALAIFEEVLDLHMKNKEKCTLLKKMVAEEVNRFQDPGLNDERKNAYSGDYVISFCLDYDSPLMWSEYSDFTGYCMAFDFEKLLKSFIVKPVNFMHGKVIYDHEEQINLMERAIENEFINEHLSQYISSWLDLDNLVGESLSKFCWEMSMIVCGYSMFFKLPCFEGENEYRFIFWRMHYGNKGKQEDYVTQFFRTRNGVLIPFIKEKMINLDALEKVMVGAKNKSDIAVKGLKHFFKYMKMNVVIEESQMPLRY